MATLRRERLLSACVPADRLSALYTELDASARLAEGEVPFFDVRELIARGLHAAGVHDLDPEPVRAAWSLPAAGLIPLLPGVETFLRALRDAGIRCFLLSNAFVRTAADYRLDFEAEGLLRWIDGIVSSVDTLWRKPDRRIFEAAMTHAGTPARACVMVGNSEAKDIAPAQSLGMRTVRVCIEEPVDPSSAADAVCGSLTEAAEAVRRLRVAC